MFVTFFHDLVQFQLTEQNSALNATSGASSTWQHLLWGFVQLNQRYLTPTILNFTGNCTDNTLFWTLMIKDFFGHRMKVSLKKSIINCCLHDWTHSHVVCPANWPNTTFSELYYQRNASTQQTMNNLINQKIISPTNQNVTNILQSTSGPFFLFTL